jgi:Fe-S cluster biogenesis protein NfuA
MGIRSAIRSMREGGSRGPGRDLVLTEAAVEEARARLSTAGEAIAFFVLTQPSTLGFDVGVGFEPLDTESSRRPRPEFEFPVLISDEDWDRLAGFTIDFREGRFVTFSDVTVHVAETPNPQSRKFIVNRDFMTEGSATYTRPVKEQDSSLAKLLFEIPQVKMLFFINNFCSVTQEAGTNWDEFQNEVGNRLQGYFAHGGLAMIPPPADDANYSEVERKIMGILEDVVRPAVQRDGGDIAFAGYEEGTVQLYMLGSCVGCPSSMATLKMGVENLLKDAVPEVHEVVAID